MWNFQQLQVMIWFGRKASKRYVNIVNVGALICDRWELGGWLFQSPVSPTHHCSVNSPSQRERFPASSFSFKPLEIHISIWEFVISVGFHICFWLNEIKIIWPDNCHPDVCLYIVSLSKHPERSLGQLGSTQPPPVDPARSPFSEWTWFSPDPGPRRIPVELSRSNRCTNLPTGFLSRWESKDFLLKLEVPPMILRSCFLFGTLANSVQSDLKVWHLGEIMGSHTMLRISWVKNLRYKQLSSPKKKSYKNSRCFFCGC